MKRSRGRRIAILTGVPALVVLGIFAYMDRLDLYVNGGPGTPFVDKGVTVLFQESAKFVENPVDPPHIIR